MVGAARGPSGCASRRSPTQAKEHGLSDDAELDDIADAFEQWAAEPDGVFVVVHVEVLAHAPD